MGLRGFTYGAEGSLMGLSIHLWSRGLTYGAEGSLMGLSIHLWG